MLNHAGRCPLSRAGPELLPAGQLGAYRDFWVVAPFRQLQGAFVHGQNDDLRLEGVEATSWIEQVLAVLPELALVQFDVDPRLKGSQAEEARQLGRGVAAGESHSRSAPSRRGFLAAQALELNGRRGPIDDAVGRRHGPPKLLVGVLDPTLLAQCRHPFQPPREGGREPLCLIHAPRGSAMARGPAI